MSIGWKKTVSPASISRWTMWALGSKVVIPWYILLTPPLVKHSTLYHVLYHQLVAYLPFWVAMRLKLSLVCSWYDYQTAILTVDLLHRCPRAHYPVSRSEWEIVEIWKREKIAVIIMMMMAGTGIPWWRGWRLVLEPVSGGLLINIVCIAMMSGPVKHST